MGRKCCLVKKSQSFVSEEKGTHKCGLLGVIKQSPVGGDFNTEVFVGL